MKNLLKFLTIAFMAISITSCGDDDDDIYIYSPSINQDLTTTTTDKVSFMVKLNNGGDNSNGMTCIVHWRQYASKPSSTPGKSDMTQHEYMSIFATTNTTTTFYKEHSGSSEGAYIYYYFEYGNSEYNSSGDILRYSVVESTGNSSNNSNNNANNSGTDLANMLIGTWSVLMDDPSWKVILQIKANGEYIATDYYDIYDNGTFADKEGKFAGTYYLDSNEITFLTSTVINADYDDSVITGSYTFNSVSSTYFEASDEDGWKIYATKQ